MDELWPVCLPSGAIVLHLEQQRNNFPKSQQELIIHQLPSVLQNDTGHSPAPSKEEEKRCKPLGNPLIDICKLCEEDNQNHESPTDVSEVRLKQERISAEKIKELKDQHAEQFTKFGIVIDDIMGTK
ncbi:uncharacterized protein LOC124612964 isoform X2 [Schistocerca americana]|uniref:uncharacterized protein LOC124612964 isoform X2 n=1 Tax=Schistocerca americana TaxID=7009 RepID=UPI001F4F17E4|nr:uncharacterized protein LOC124612964 isoform X2 [Schistocerca americana]